MVKSGTISKTLNSEKYYGDVVLGKTQVRDGVQVKTGDSDTKTVMRDRHPAIIAKKLFHLSRKKKVADVTLMKDKLREDAWALSE